MPIVVWVGKARVEIFRGIDRGTLVAVLEALTVAGQKVAS
jgi:hypothetical protein